MNIKDMAKQVGGVRSDFLSRVEKAVGDTTVFAIDVSNAIGEISLAEAEQGIIDFFSEQIKKRKV